MHRRQYQSQDRFSTTAESTKRSSAYDLSWAVVGEVKHKKNYKASEELFQQLIQAMNIQIDHPNGNNTKWVGENCRFAEADGFRKAMAALVRYAPNPQKALDYTTFYMRDINEPLRTRISENYILINLIYVYTQTRINSYLEKGLDLVKHGLERGLASQVPLKNTSQQDVSAEVFETVCQPILRYHGLQFSADKTSLQPANKRY
ncbi:hypothetical protein CLU79DRAFT_716459 [Phycomyces nitens]|nr:hypothetical protein CLU79DRAFT_716459 [Phycomyces nitens]